MATSSITANFRIDDPKEASAFVKAFLAPCDTTRKPRRAKSAVKCRFIANLDELKLYRKSLSVQKQIGGKVVFVEYEKDRPKLLDFYKRHSFEEFKAPSDADAGDKLGQLFRFLK